MTDRRSDLIMHEITQHLERMEARLIGRIDEAKRDITSRQDRTNGNVGKALDRTSRLQGVIEGMQAEIRRLRERVHDLGSRTMSLFSELPPIIRPPSIGDATTHADLAGDDRYWRWRDTRWLVLVVGGTIAATIGLLRMLGWGPS